MRLFGFQSTSVDKDVAIGFATYEHLQRQEELVCIVYKMTFNDPAGIFDISPFSDFQDEKEMLV